MTLPRAQRSLKPLAIALGAFGGIVALACLLIGGQLIGRQLRRGAGERAVLRALGAGPGQVWADGLLGIIASVLAGTSLAVAVAIGLSPLAPLGPVRPVYPDLGASFDWTVLGLGAMTLVVPLGTALAPSRSARRSRARSWRW